MRLPNEGATTPSRKQNIYIERGDVSIGWHLPKKSRNKKLQDSADVFFLLTGTMVNNVLRTMSGPQSWSLPIALHHCWSWTWALPTSPMATLRVLLCLYKNWMDVYEEWMQLTPGHFPFPFFSKRSLEVTNTAWEFDNQNIFDPNRYRRRYENSPFRAISLQMCPDGPAAAILNYGRKTMWNIRTWKAFQTYLELHYTRYLSR